METESEAGDFGIVWPQEFSELLEPIREAWEVEGEVVLVRRLGGLSGARVFIADLVTAGFSGKAILKLTEDDEDDVESEAARQANAAAADPDYGAAHFPTVVASVAHAGRTATLSTVAGRGLEYVTAWNDCGYSSQLATSRQLARDLLSEWNAGFRLASGHVAPATLLNEWVGYRLGEDSGRIGDLVRDSCGFEAEEPTFIEFGEWFPNPLAFARGVVEVPSSAWLRPILGNVHGDLHGDNVLISTRPPIRSTYYIIDFADYEADRHLFWDHAYFELAHLLAQRSSQVSVGWKALLDAVSRFPRPMADAHLSGDDHGHVQMVDGIRREVADWIDREVPHRLPDLDAQYLLARVGVGLTWAHRRLPEQTRLKAFLYAAANLRDYLHLARIAWPSWGPPLLRPAADGPAPGAATPGRRQAQVATASDASDPSPDPEDVARRTAGRTAFEVYRARPQVAVLPFEDRTGDPEQAFLADAITEELLIELSRIDWLMPVAKRPGHDDKAGRTTAEVVGAEFGVPYVVEGSVRRHGDAVRITAVLEETEHGAKIWGDKFDVHLDELHELEDRMVTAIVAHVESKLKGSEQDRARRKPRNDLDAWELTQRASWHQQRRTREDDERAEQLALAAIERDPGYSTPHAILAEIYCPMLDPARWPLEPDRVAQSLQHARTAVRLDSGDGYAHGALGRTLMSMGRTEAALEQFERYAELNPSSSHARLLAAFALLILGRPEEARQTVEIAIALSPHDTQAGWEYFCQGLCNYVLGDYESAEASLRRSARRPATAPLAELARAAVLMHLDRADDAAGIVDRVLEEAGPRAFAGARQFGASWRGSLFGQLRDDLIAAGMAPELWVTDHP